LIPPIAPIAPLRVRAYTAVTAAGAGRRALLDALVDGRSGLRPNDLPDVALETWIGRVDGLETSPLPARLADWECRNHRLAWRGLQADGFIDDAAEACRRHGADRVALVLGTSTSSIGETEAAYRARDADGRFPASMRRTRVHTLHSLGLFVAEALGVHGPALTVSTACSSSAKAFASAERLLRAGLCDAAIVGGVDTLCGNVLHGFHALQLVSRTPCRPFDAGRDGISLGEAAGFALLERDASGSGALLLRGYGESSDAHHMSSPHPQGAGAERALDEALARAGLAADDIDYLNLHGTASAKNDEVEAALVARRFGARLHASSTKGLTGHTLGAAGIVEAVACLLAIEHGVMPGTANLRTQGAAPVPAIRRETVRGRVRVAASNSFGFGGNNAVLVFAQGGR
jgi:3-oxoacyl-[acyl-carrier-protein] synthase-1